MDLPRGHQAALTSAPALRAAAPAPAPHAFVARAGRTRLWGSYGRVRELGAQGAGERLGMSEMGDSVIGRCAFCV